MPRILKQTLFGLFFLAVFGGVVFWIYQSTRPVLTCFDKIQNQDEEGVDCGGKCQILCRADSIKPIVYWQRFFKVYTYERRKRFF